MLPYTATGQQLGAGFQPLRHYCSTTLTVSRLFSAAERCATKPERWRDQAWRFRRHLLLRADRRDVANSFTGEAMTTPYSAGAFAALCGRSLG